MEITFEEFKAKYPSYDLIFGAATPELYESYFEMYRFATGEYYDQYPLFYCPYYMKGVLIHGLSIEKTSRDAYIDSLIRRMYNLCVSAKNAGYHFRSSQFLEAKPSEQ